MCESVQEVHYILVESGESFIIRITPFFIQSSKISQYLAVTWQNHGELALLPMALCKCVCKFSVVNLAEWIRKDRFHRGQGVWLRGWDFTSESWLIKLCLGFLFKASSTL